MSPISESPSRLSSVLHRKKKKDRPHSNRTPSEASSVNSERQPSFDASSTNLGEPISRNSTLQPSMTQDSRRSSESADPNNSKRHRLSALLKIKRKGHNDSASDLGDSHLDDSTTILDSHLQKQAPYDAAVPSLQVETDKGDVDASSLLTDGSDDEILQRPTLTPHDSHKGLLTLSNPQIVAETIDTRDIASIADVPIGSSQRGVSPAPLDPLAKESTGTRSRAGSAASQRRVQIVDGKPVITDAIGQSSPLKKPTLQGIATVLPVTPPNGAAPPSTFVTPPTPTLSENRDNLLRGRDETRVGKSSPSPVHRSSAAGHSRSGSEPKIPSRLAHQLSRPLTPAVEEVKTPGGGFSAPGSGGFFSSVFSAAQNAATSLTNTVASAAGTRSRSGTVDAKELEGEDLERTTSPESIRSTGEGKRELAINTLGLGSLSLSHLGLSDSAEGSHMASNHLTHDEAAAHAEDNAAQKAISEAYSEKSETNRPPSIDSRSTLQEPQTPAKGDDASTIVRASSVRSRLSGHRRRTRGSSSATGATVGIPLPSQRLGGFAVANSKRNRDFHTLFKSVPEDDYLIEDYSAALQREILLQGRLYISEGHVCFSSNIFGYVTNLIISFDEVMSVEKKSTALIFQNGLIINTLHAKHSFASLLNRDTTYDLIVNIWKISHPHLRSSLNGTPVAGNDTGDKTEKAESGDEDDSASEEVYDEDEEDSDEDDDGDGDASFVEANEGASVAGSEAADPPKTTNRKVSAVAGQPPAPNGAPSKSGGDAPTAKSGGDVAAGGPGPATHGPTECTDQDKHYEKLLIDSTIPAPLGKIYSLLFGPESAEFMRKFMSDNQKCFDVEIEKDEKGMGEEKKKRNYSYIKPLGGSIGPKQTKCIINETLETFDLEKAVSVDISTQNPDVPNGGMFVVKTRYCLTWAANNSTRMVANCTIEWSGKSWIKGAIEKGANEGQTQYTKDLTAALKAAVSKGGASKGPSKGKKGGKRRRDTVDSTSMAEKTSGSGTQLSTSSDWGLFEPLHGILGPLEPLFSPPAIIAFLVITIIGMWWRARSASASGHLGSYRYSSAARMAAYEHMWAAEEAELWDWLEDRVGLAGISPGYDSSTPILDDPSVILDPKKQKQAAQQAVREKADRQKMIENAKKKVKKQTADSKGVQQELEEAIKVTRERLETLEQAVRHSHPKEVDNDSA